LRRGQIVAAARALVAEAGLEALTVSALEARLSFSRGVITYHFENKDEIIDAVLESAIKEIGRANRIELDQLSSIEDKLRRVMRTTVKGFVGHTEAGYILMSFWSRIPADARVTRINAELYARYRRLARELLAEGRRSGLISREISLDDAAALMVAAVIGIATQVYFQPGAIDPDTVADLASSAIISSLSNTERARPTRGRRTGTRATNLRSTRRSGLSKRD
jgi:AcrR family transcriptional regulator